MKYQPNDIIVFKLLSGEEVISKVVSNLEKEIIVVNPIMLVPTPEGIAVTPYLVTVEKDTKLSFNKNTIVVISKAAEKIKSQYIQVTTGLVTAINSPNNLVKL